jgi:hypothetical protein
MKMRHVNMVTLSVAAALAVAVIVGVLTPRPARVSRDHIANSQHGRKAIPADVLAPIRAKESFGKLPLRFEANHGQTDPSVKFLSRGPGYGMFLTQTEVVLVVPKRGTSGQNRPTVVKMQLRGANKKSELTGVDQLAGNVNYFIGDRANWRTDVPTYSKVRYRDVYPGIDSVYYGSGRQLEYDFIVSPGADPAAIRFGFEGTEHLTIASSGNLVMEAQGQQMQLVKPVVYQQISGQRREISAEYVLLDERNVVFKLADYDRTAPLVIDPTVLYATYIGGTDDDAAAGVAVDSSGNLYVTGSTNSIDFPGTNSGTPFQGTNAGPADSFITKIDPTGSTYLYSTYVGGEGSDVATKIAVDASGNAYITGYTLSTMYPLSHAPMGNALGGGQDAFVTELNATGNALVFSEYLGGATGAEAGTGIAADSNGNVYVGGTTTSTDFPVVNGPYMTAPGVAGMNHDGFAAKINGPIGANPTTIEYATYLGGLADDVVDALAIDTASPPSVYVIGTTNSSDYPSLHPIIQNAGGFQGGHDAFVTKISESVPQQGPPVASVAYSTYLGGSGEEYAFGLGFGIAVDSSGTAYVTGTTNSTNFPITPSVESNRNFQPNLSGGGALACFNGTSLVACSDAFVSKLTFNSNTNILTLTYSTYLGGTALDAGFGIAIDSSGTAYVVGTTISSDFPTANPTQANYSGGTCHFQQIGIDAACPEAFITKVTSSGSGTSLRVQVPFSTYLGGPVEDWGYGIAFYSGNIYVVGYTSGAFPTVNPKQSSFAGGAHDGFIAKFQDTLKKVRAQLISN